MPVEIAEPQDGQRPENAAVGDAAAPGDADTPVDPADDATAGPPPRPPIPLRRNRDFRVILLGQGVSAVGDAVSTTALPLLVLQLTGSGVAMGIVGALSTLPDLLFGLPAGAIADRVDRRRLMLLADAGRAALTALIPLSVLLNIPTMGVILLVTFPINIFRVLFMSGWSGAVPNLVDRRVLGRAVSAVEGIVSLSYVIGPAVAGILVGLIGAPQTLAIDAASFAFSAASLMLIRRPFQAERTGERLGMLAAIREGMTFIVRHRALRLAIAAWTGGNIAKTGLIAGLAFAITVDRGMGAQDVGFVFSAFGIGTLLGALAGGRFTHGRLAPPFLGGYLVQAGAVLVMGIPASLPLVVLLAAALIDGLGSGFTIVSYLTYRAQVTPDRLMGRVGSTARTISTGLEPIGMLCTGILLDAIGGNRTILLMGASLLLLTGTFALSPTLRAARGEVHAVSEAA